MGIAGLHKGGPGLLGTSLGRGGGALGLFQLRGTGNVAGRQGFGPFQGQASGVALNLGRGQGGFGGAGGGGQILGCEIRQDIAPFHPVAQIDGARHHPAKRLERHRHLRARSHDAGDPAGVVAPVLHDLGHDGAYGNRNLDRGPEVHPSWQAQRVNGRGHRQGGQHGDQARHGKTSACRTCRPG